MNDLLRFGLVLLSGELIVYTHTHLGLLSLCALSPWILALLAPDPQGERITTRNALLISWLPYAIAALHMWGLGEFGGMIHAAAAFYLPIAGILFALLTLPARLLPWHHPANIPLFASAWTLADATRAFEHIGFPALLGPCLADLPVLAQIASITGPWGLDFIAASTSTLLAQITLASLHTQPHTKHLRISTLSITAALSAVLLFGSVRLARAPISLTPHDAPHPPHPNTHAVTLIQTATPNWVHRRAWTLPPLQDAIDSNTQTLIHDAYTRNIPTHQPHWIILPESAFGKAFPPPNKLPKALADVLPPRPSPNTTLFLTATTRLDTPSPQKPRADRTDTTWVLSFPTSQDLPKLLDHSSKHLLVPLAERLYLPGPFPKPVQTPQGPIGTLICYESLFPNLSLHLARQNAQALLISTNDAGQRWSTAAQWHARLSILRSIETGLPLFHASQSGPSFAVDPYGRRTPTLQLFQRGTLNLLWTPHTTHTLYRSIGPWILLIPGLLWLFLSVWIRRTRPNITPKIPPNSNTIAASDKKT